MNRDAFSRGVLWWSRRFVWPVAVVVVLGLVAPFVLHPLLGSGADNALGYVGIIAFVIALIGAPGLVLPMGLATASLGTVEGSVVTVQTVRGPRSADLARLRAVRTLFVYGKGTNSVIWWLRDSAGGRVVFRVDAGDECPVLAALRPAVIDLAASGQWRPGLRVRKELRLDDSSTTNMLARMLVAVVQYLVLIACGCAVLAAYVGLYSLAGISSS